MPTAPLPPGPRSSLPQLIHMRDPFPLMDRFLEQYTDPMTCPLPGQPAMVLTWSESGLREVLSAPAGTFLPGASEALAQMIGRGSLFFQSGSEHQRSRKLLMPPFHGDRMRAYAELMQGAARTALTGFEPDKSRPVLPLTQALTLDIICSAIFGAADRQVSERLCKEIVDLVAAFGPIIATFKFMQRELGGIGPWARFQRRLTALKRSMDQLMEEKRAQPGDDILSLLLSARDETGQSLSKEDIYSQLLTFVVAGHETTATTLAWALYEIYANPECHQRLKHELAEAADAPQGFAKLPFLTAVCRETLRRHPPLPIVPRRCAAEFRLGEYVLPAGQSLGLAVYMAHHQPGEFPEPHEFRPERFVDRSYSPFVYLPFGGGPRRCLGAAFALYELQIVLGTLLSESDFLLNEDKPVGNAFRTGTYGPATGVRMTRIELVRNVVRTVQR